MTDCPNTDIYKWIKRGQTYLTSRQRADIIELLHFDIEKNFGLRKEEWETIAEKIKLEPTVCQHVIFDTGRKCLSPIFNENKCKKHY